MLMSEAPEELSSLPRPELVRRMRKSFGITQAQLAAALGTSVKAVQSYEQGWRRVPTRTLIQLLVLYAIHHRRQLDNVPCWEIRNCAEDVRQRCPSYAVGEGQFCWFLCAGSGHCVPDTAAAVADNEDLLPCMGCAVIKRLLQTTRPEGKTKKRRPS